MGQECSNAAKSTKGRKVGVVIVLTSQIMYSIRGFYSEINRTPLGGFKYKEELILVSKKGIQNLLFLEIRNFLFLPGLASLINFQGLFSIALNLV